MSKHHLIFLGVGIIGGYLLCTTLVSYDPWKTAYTKGAGAA